MSNRQSKPKLSSKELISKMKAKGITFIRMSENDAEKYLSMENNYLRAASYRKNYQKKKTRGNQEESYIKLDFGDLVELSTIDMYFRFVVTRMCINLEHSLKISLLHDFETNPYCDGYAIVDDFLTKYPYLMKNIATISNAPFTTDLVNKYFQLKRNDDGKTNKITNVDCPIWVFLELITFGDLLTFLTYYYRRTNTKQRISCNILKLTKSLRNGCAHNNCILANLQRGSSSEPPEISREIAKIRTISKEQRNKKLSCRPMLEFTALLYAHSKIVSGQVKKSDTKELLELFLERMLRHKDFFQGNELIISNYQFACK